jgi:uncharacterized protein YgbK (DUF1537 family)
VADDLTGACDAAVQFAARGLPARVLLGKASQLSSEPVSAGDVLALSTESRSLDSRQLQTLWGAFPPRLPARILFKKIDSTLRGSVGLELALAGRAFEADTVLISPAFPEMGRTVESGWLLVNRLEFAPIEMRRYWEAQGLSLCVHVATGAVRDAIAAGGRFVSVDACCNADLDAIAAAGLGSGRRILWAGSGGLAAALSRALRPGAAPKPPAAARAAAVLFCIGSTHPATAEQERALAEARPVSAFNDEDAAPEEICEALDRGVHVLLHLRAGRVSPERIRTLTGVRRVPLALSGGDTASAVCGARSAHARSGSAAKSLPAFRVA